MSTAALVWLESQVCLLELFFLARASFAFEFDFCSCCFFACHACFVLTCCSSRTAGSVRCCVAKPPTHILPLSGNPSLLRLRRVSLGLRRNMRVLEACVRDVHCGLLGCLCAIAKCLTLPMCICWGCVLGDVCLRSLACGCEGDIRMMCVMSSSLISVVMHAAPSQPA